jgi:hypothetical protein
MQKLTDMKKLAFSTVVAVFTILFTGCWQNGPFGIQGEGPVVERKINLDEIRGLSIPGAAEVFLTQGSIQEVRISAQENIIDNLHLEVHGDIWEIGNKRAVWKNEPIKIFITLKSLKLIKVSGSSKVSFVNHFTDLKEMDINITGSGKIDVDADVVDIHARISGSGDIIMKGKADLLGLNISGSGGIFAESLTARIADVGISGSGGIQITVEERLDAHISGSGSIVYGGNPKVNSSISGSGSVVSR